MNDTSSYVEERSRMVDNQIAGRGVRDERVLEAMKAVPRHSFVQPEYQYLAYTDGPLPIGNGQTISQPYIVALMTELLELEGQEKVLEVGTGSGYQAAILGYLCKEVHSIERHPDLARYATKILEQLGFDNVKVYVGDGTLGLADQAPFDAIIVTAGAPNVPQVLLDQLAESGRMVIPVGSRGGQYLERWQREGEKFKREPLIPVAFVPLIGDEGWKS
jgi:protein-L-isoaspartate(D-aspartate) O-methyltransferase